MKARNQDLFAIVLFMAVATTLTAPPFLRRMLKGQEMTDEGYDGRETVSGRVSCNAERTFQL